MRHRSGSVARLLTVVILLASWVATGSAQTQGGVTGTVTDPSGAVIPQARVTATNVATNIATDATATAGKPLRYILDQAESNLYRVTLLVGNQSLTRAYSAAQNGTLYPAGAWVRKE